MNLPQDFKTKMQMLLQDEYRDFMDTYSQRPYRGVLLNTLKCSENKIPVLTSKSPFSPFSYYLKSEDKIGDLKEHHMGMIYSQEPSASCAVTAMKIKKGDRVLDLCAAPGGKSVQIALSLDSSGMLWSNEIVRRRADILLSNLERMGVRNAVVSSLHPKKLCDALKGYFDKVLVDAPCSGEGMFRKDDAAHMHWSQNHVNACSKRQLSILESAGEALREGGILVYSTCTFSPEENEEVVAQFLKKHPEFEQEDIEASFGRRAYDGKSLRVFPMDAGEGHFAARLKRIGSNAAVGDIQRSREAEKEVREVFESLLIRSSDIGALRIGDKYFIPPEIMPDFGDLPVLRCGVEAAIVKKGRIEPAHGLFMAYPTQEFKKSVGLNDESLRKFLRGEEIEVSYEESGFCAAGYNGINAGFGKASGGRLKNRYPKGLRSLR